jgi:hypothetical protein
VRFVCVCVVAVCVCVSECLCVWFASCANRDRYITSTWGCDTIYISFAVGVEKEKNEQIHYLQQHQASCKVIILCFVSFLVCVVGNWTILVQIVSRLLILIFSLLILCLHVCVDIVLCSREEWLLRSNVSSISFLRFQPHP